MGLGARRNTEFETNRRRLGWHSDFGGHMGMSVRAVRLVRLVGNGLTLRLAHWHGGQDASKI